MTYPAGGGYPDSPPPGGGGQGGWQPNDPTANPYQGYSDDSSTKGTEYAFDQPTGYAAPDPYGPTTPQGPSYPQYTAPVTGVPMSPGPQPGGPMMMGPGGPIPPPPQKSSNPALIITVCVIIAVVLGLGVFTVIKMNDDGDTTADPTTHPPTTSESPSADTPSSDPAPPDGTAITHEEFANDWDFKFGDVELFATYANGWTYEDCAPVEVGGYFTDYGCDYALEVTHRAEDEELYLTTIVMVMPDESTAEEALNSGFEAENFKSQDESQLSGYSYGQWRANYGGKYIVLVLCTASADVDTDKAQEYLDNRTADMAAAMIWY